MTLALSIDNIGAYEPPTIPGPSFVPPATIDYRILHNPSSPREICMTLALRSRRRSVRLGLLVLRLLDPTSTGDATREERGYERNESEEQPYLSGQGGKSRRATDVICDGMRDTGCRPDFSDSRSPTSI